MYGEGRSTTHPKEASQFMRAVFSDLTIARARFEAAQAWLSSQPSVRKASLAALGYCFGGTVLHQMVRIGVPLKGIVTFHAGLGGLVPPKESIKAKILVFNGAEDRMVPSEQVEELKTQLKKNGADYRVVNMPDAQHSFTNPDASRLGDKLDLPLSYNEKAAKESWKETFSFLDELFSH